MSKVKTITTVAPVKVAGMEVGSIMQDKDGYFYRAKGLSGAHDWRKDNDHRPTIDDVKQDLPPGGTIPQVKAPQEKKGQASKPAPQGQKPQPKAEAPQKAPQAKETPQATQSPQVKPDHAQTKPQEAAKAGQERHKGNKPDPRLIHATASGVKPVSPGEEVKTLVRESLERIEEQRKAQGPGHASKVRYKLVEAQGRYGVQYWLYPGYNRPQGFKWESLSGFMFLSLADVETFLALNGIAITEEVEKADVSQGSYNPNKGVIPNDDPNGQRNLL